ncbi:uncharacterized protein FIBRA_05886 [Fibroporia radiculosa]|uniref:Uncharacterized protein n=1 Tax=Fibroporia radiculosa TaxID=599839 RepID=J4GRS9_9APHY|nr:uncharacterized protein FIBRA_05886 [Fibroporia radiculosa]CCM03740.1 predicted protein [Fibroporia radiculosa]
MSSFLARLLYRGTPQQPPVDLVATEQGAETSISPTLLDAPPVPFAAPPIRTVNRPIVPDISSLLESYSSSEPEGLRPPRRAKQAGASRFTHSEGRSHDQTVFRDTGNLPRPVSSSSSTSSKSPSRRALPADIVSLSPSRRSLSRFSRQLVSVSPWATFGRHREGDLATQGQPVPPPSAWTARIASVESLAPRRSSSSKRKPAHSKQSSSASLSRFASPSRASSDALPSRSVASVASEGSSPSGHDDDDRDYVHASTSQHQAYFFPHDSNTSTNSRLQTTRSSHSVSHSFVVGTPHTFGNPSPLANFPLRDRRPSESSPRPPLPPLEHPELVLALGSRSDVDISRQASANKTKASPRKYPKWTAGLQASTYPRRRHKTAENIPPLPGRTIRPATSPPLRRHASLPKAQRVFHAPQEDCTADFSTSRRRTSAEWNAQQAIAGVTALMPSEFGWPAEVAQHLLKLSLGEDTGQFGVARHRDVRGRPENAEPRGTQVASQSESPCPCYPSSFIPALSEPPSLQPSTAQEGRDSHTVHRMPLLTWTATLAAESHDGRDLLHAMDTPASIKPQNPNKDDGKASKLDDATGTLRRSASASGRGDTMGRTRAKRAFHKSAPSPLGSPSKSVEAGPSSSLPPSPLSTPSPPSRRRSTHRPSRWASEPGLKSVPETPTNTKGKRKAEELDITPPDQKNGHRATFLIPEENRRPHRLSESSRAPSSYHRKRARLAASSPASSPSRPGSGISAANAASWPSRTTGSPLHRTGSHAASAGSMPRAESLASKRTDRRHSVSEQSIPISALIAPHAPSIGRSSAYHMRDPRKPPKVQRTEWIPHLKSEEEEASPLHAWCFFIGFILFPVWWIVSFCPIPQTRQVGGSDTEKAVTLDDPQVEHGVYFWRVYA